jgi:hypothetical protein
MNFFTTGVALEFTGDGITGIEERLERQEKCCMPLRSFYPLAMGCGPLERLMSEASAIFMHAKNRLLIETLFPVCDSYLYTPY